MTNEVVVKVPIVYLVTTTSRERANVPVLGRPGYMHEMPGIGYIRI
jgi:hypothetical protein